MDILEPDKISEREPLFGGNLGLDALDLVELALCVEEVFGVSIVSGDGSRRAFANVGSLADFIHAQTQTVQSWRESPAEAPVVLPALPTLPQLI